MDRKRRGWVFGSLCSLVFLVNFSRVVYAPLLEPLRAAFTMTAGTAGLVATLAWLGSAIPRLPTGYLLTRVPRQHVVLGSGLVLTAAALFSAAANSVLAVAVGAFLMGTASGAYFIAANPLVSELYPQRVGRAIGVHGMASQLAAVAAPLAVTAVLATTVWPVAAWRVVFVGVAVVAALATATFFVLARRTDLPNAGVADRNVLAAVRAQWHIVLTGIAIIGATGFVWNAVFNLYVTYLAESKAIAEATGRTLLTGVFAAGVPAFLLTGRVADRISHVRLLLGILGGFVVCLLALTAVTDLWAVVAVSLVFGFVVHGLFPALDTYLLDSLPDHHRASAYAFYSATMMLVQASGSAVVGQAVDEGIPVVAPGGIAFDAVWHRLAAGLVVVLVVLLVLFRLDRLPQGGGTGSHVDGASESADGT